MREEINSVGIDIGTSTTQVVFSKIVLENMSSGARIPQIKIVSKEVVYRSNLFHSSCKSNRNRCTSCKKDCGRRV